MEEVKRKKAEYRSSIRSKQMIKDALLSLMIEKPFEKISITDIVRRADINRGTFYAHYSNTDEVLKGFQQVLSMSLPPYLQIPIPLRCFLRLRISLSRLQCI